MPAPDTIRVYSPATIVVEGRHDTEAVQRAVDCDTIETLGMDVDGALPHIREALGEGQVFLLTDSDPSGERIRAYIHQEVPGCRDARVSPTNGHRNARVENASNAQIIKALREAGVELRYRLPVIESPNGQNES